MPGSWETPAPPRPFSPHPTPLIVWVDIWFCSGPGPMSTSVQERIVASTGSFLFFGGSKMPEVVFQEASTSSQQSWETALGRGPVHVLFTSPAQLCQPRPSSYILMMLPRCGARSWPLVLTRTAAVPCSKIDQALLSIRPRCGDRWTPTSNLHAQSPYKGSGDVFNITHLPQATFSISV